MRHTARAIIIKGGKILLVSGHDADFYWTPGGGVKDGESPIDALKRELQEELGVNIKTAKLYSSYIFEETQKVDAFLTEIIGDISINAEIDKTIWLSKKDFEDDIIKISRGLRIDLIPHLIADGLF